MANVHIVKGDKAIHQLASQVSPSTIRNAFGIPSDTPVILEKGRQQYSSTPMDTFNPALQPGKYRLVSSGINTYNTSEVGTLKDGTSSSNLTLCQGNVRFHYGDGFFDLNLSNSKVTLRTLRDKVSTLVNHKFRETSLFIFSSDGSEVKDVNETVFSTNKEYYLFFPCQQPLEAPCHVPTVYDEISSRISCRWVDENGTLYLTDLLMPFVAVAKICYFFGTSPADYELDPQKYPIFSTSFKACILEAGLKLNAAFASINETAIDSSGPKSLKQGILDFLVLSRQAELTLNDILLNTFIQSKEAKNPMPSLECVQSAVAAQLFRQSNGDVETNPIRELDREVLKNFSQKPEEFFKRLPALEIDVVVKLGDLSSSYEHYRNIVFPLLEATKCFDFSLGAVFDMLRVLLKIVWRTNNFFEYYPALLTQIDSEAAKLGKNVADLPQPSKKIHSDYATCFNLLKKLGPYGYTSDVDLPLDFLALKKSVEDAQFAYANAVNAEFVKLSNNKRNVV